MADWSTFYPRLMPRVMGCAAPLANAELRNSAFEFFEKTRSWREWLSAITVEDGVRHYAIPIPPGTRAVRVEQATMSGKPLSVDGAFAFEIDPAASQGPNHGVSSADRASLLLSKDGAAGELLQVQASLVPSETASGIPDHLAWQYADAILAGALFRIRTIPDQPFTDIKRAAVDLAKSMAEIDRVKGLAWRTHTNNQPRKRPTWC